MSNVGIFEVFDLALSVIQDVALAESIRCVENAQREYLFIEADNNRRKSDAVIKAIAQIDIEFWKMKLTYDKVKGQLGSAGEEVMEQLLDTLSKERERLIKEKKAITKGK